MSLHTIEYQAGLAMAQAMFACTFGIVGDNKAGEEGKGLGTGIGVLWKGKHLIVTAAHVIEATPIERTYFFLPGPPLTFVEPGSQVDWSSVRFQQRHSVSTVQPLLGGNGEDLAGLLVPPQPTDVTEKHFYRLDDTHTTPSLGTEVGYLGYPAARTSPLGENFMASPYHAFGSICSGREEYDPSAEMLVEYRPGSEAGDDRVDPHGLSGSGIWHSPQLGVVWSPRPTLAGVVTRCGEAERFLIAYRVEAVTRFLKDREAEGWL